MLTYTNPATADRAVPAKNSRPEKRSQFVAHWTQVNGKLVCQWLPQRSLLEN
ncbi:MAG: hypothetical protein AAF572_13310 [Cyanobacteria bacterium P01_B01_bin.77]